jgi:uncharacterized spore protein YtfJ
VTLDFEAIARHIAQTIEHSGNAKAVYGEPVKLQTQTIVPVAAVVAAVGGGGGQASIVGAGGGGGFTIRVIPLGYIHEKDGAVMFSPIEVPDELLAPERAMLPSVPEDQPLMSRLAKRVLKRS